MSKVLTAQSFATFRLRVEDIGTIDPKAQWIPLSGGRSNLVWKIATGTKTLVCKLYDDSKSSDFFPNDHDAEITSLKHLEGTSIAPELVGEFQTEFGHVVLYTFAEGRLWSPGQPGLATALRCLHRIDPPVTLRRAATTHLEIASQTEKMLSECQGRQASIIAKVRPVAFPDFMQKPSFIHGDLVPNNVVMNGAAATLIDWQCPAVGDPCDDISTLFSPAMSLLYGDTMPLDTDIDAFFVEYDEPNVRARFEVLRPIYHWRMAAYCLWKAQRGAHDYLQGLEVELEALGEAGS